MEPCQEALFVIKETHFKSKKVTLDAMNSEPNWPDNIQTVNDIPNAWLWEVFIVKLLWKLSLLERYKSNSCQMCSLRKNALNQSTIKIINL